MKELALWLIAGICVFVALFGVIFGALYMVHYEPRYETPAQCAEWCRPLHVVRWERHEDCVCGDRLGGWDRDD